MNKQLICLVFLVSTHAAPSTAWQAGTVEGLQSPAWIERQGAMAPVAPGMALNARDKLHTGNGGRLLLRLAEGSHVKLGENARFDLDRLEPPPKPDGVFAGLLRVAKGAFRFTTTLLSRPHRRNLNIQVAAVTAGIRGTDLWGKAKSDADIVCLIEGAITVNHGDDEALTMDQPLSFYIAPKDAPPKPVAKVSREQLEQWARETELTAGQGILTAAGPWILGLQSFRDRDRATHALRRLHQDGLPAEIMEVMVDGIRWYRVVVAGFKDPREAVALTARDGFRGRFPGAWAYRR